VLVVSFVAGSGDGSGIGGGVFNAGTIVLGTLPDVFGNHASTAFDDTFGVA